MTHQDAHDGHYSNLEDGAPVSPKALATEHQLFGYKQAVPSDKYTVPIEEATGPPQVAWDASSHLPEAVSAYDGAGYGFDSSSPSPPSAKLTPTTTASAAKRRWCGLSRRAFWILCVTAAAVIVGALVGGLVGGLLPRSPRDEAIAPPNPADATERGPWYGSSLSAINWTDTDNVQRRAVFYQQDDALFVSQYTESNNSWTHLNISGSDGFVRQQGAQALNVKGNTTIAAAAKPYRDLEEGSAFVATVYYMDTDNRVKELVTRDLDLQTWSHGEAWDADLIAADDTRLSAVAYYCASDCPNQMCLTYEDKNNVVQYTCGTDWSPSPVLSAYPNSALSVIPFAAADGDNTTWVKELRLFYYSNTEIHLYQFNHETTGKWTSDVTLVTPDVPPIDGRTPQVVAAPSDHHSNIISVTASVDGKISNSWWDNGWDIDRRTTFNNEDGASTDNSPDFDIYSIAMNHNGFFYAFDANGTSLVEYSWNSSSPYVFEWNGNVVEDSP